VNREDLVQNTNQFLACDSFEDGQENGLQIEGKHEIRKVASAVSVNAETVDAAIAWGADMLLTHHGLLWKNQPLHVRGVRRSRLAKILAADLNLLTYHLPLDAHAQVGNNRALAEVAGAIHVEPAFMMRGTAIGCKASIKSQDFSSWLAKFRGNLENGCNVSTGPFQVWPHGPDKITTIGFLSGAAPYQVQDAIDAGLDVYVTGEIAEGAYHLAKEAGIHFVGGGHYLTERLGVQRLGAWMQEKFAIEHQFFDVQTLA